MRQVKDALPHFLQFLERVSEPARHRDLLDDPAVLLLAEDELGVADVQVVVNLAATLLEIGVSGERYRQRLGDFREMWERVDSPAHLDSLVDMFDVLLTHACPDHAARDSFAQVVVASFQRWRRRVRSDQWALFADLAAEVGLADAVAAVRAEEEERDSVVTAPTRTALVGKTIANYTLTESAGARAHDFLTRNFEDVVVQLSSDHVASDRLRALARAADIFVVATRSAKHAATTFIEAQRPPGRPPVYVAGKGSASLIRAILTTLGE